METRKLPPIASRPYSEGQTLRGWREHTQAANGTHPLKQGPMPRQCLTYGILLDLAELTLVPRFPKGRLSAVDLGCSAGNFWIALKASPHLERFMLHAAEIDEQSIEAARQNFAKWGLNVDLRQQDLSQRLPYGANTMHFATMSHVVTEMTLDVLSFSVSEVRRVLKTNGVFYVEMLDPTTYDLAFNIRVALRSVFHSNPSFADMEAQVINGADAFNALLNAPKVMVRYNKAVCLLKPYIPNLKKATNEAEAKALLGHLIRIGLLYPQADQVAEGQEEKYRVYLPNLDVLDLPHCQKTSDTYRAVFSESGFVLDRMITYSPVERHIAANPPMQVLGESNLPLIKVIIFSAR